MKVLFTETLEVKDEKRGTAEATIYEAGKVYDLPEMSVNRWLSRKVATIDEDLIAAAEAEDDTKSSKVRASAKPATEVVVEEKPEEDNSIEEGLKTQSGGRLTQVATSQNTLVAGPTVAGRR